MQKEFTSPVPASKSFQDLRKCLSTLIDIFNLLIEQAVKSNSVSKVKRQSSASPYVRDENSLDEDNFPFPVPELSGIPVINTKTNELIYLYFPKEDYEYINIELKPGKRTVFRDAEILPKLKGYVLSYYLKVFKHYDLEKRIERSYEDDMKYILGNISIVIMLGDKFKKRKIIQDKFKNFRRVKNDILKQTPITHNYKQQNPFKQLENNKHDNHLLKYGLTFKDKGYIPSLTKINEDNDILITSKSNHNEKIYYLDLLKELFYSKLNDFRSELIEYCIENDKDFSNIPIDPFEKFICYFEFFLLLFSGIKVKYYIDELCNLNMDLYASEKTLMNIAETFHYQVQFRILDLPIISSSKNDLFDREGNRISMNNYAISKEKNLFIKNQQPFEEYNMNYVENFPPFTNFIKVISNKFRRYDKHDKYHLCSECQTNASYKKAYELTCSSCFRQIDKNRLIYSMLLNIINLALIEQSIYGSSNNNKSKGSKVSESSKDLIKKVFKDILIIHNTDTIQTLTSNTNVIKGFISPIEIKETKCINSTHRNLFGEEIGFYYIWLTHYIKWLLIPSIFGLIVHVCNFISKNLHIFNNQSTVFLFMNLIFAGSVIIWGHYYVKSWNAFENVYRYIWGMEAYKLEKMCELVKTPNQQFKMEHFIGVKIPIYNSFDKYVKNFVSIIIISLTLLFTIIINLLVFYLEKGVMYENDDSPLASKTLKKIAKGYSLYAIPIITYVIREMLTNINKKIAKWLTNKESNITKEEYNESYLKKTICFEYVNYYFNLFYIAFGKRYFEKCLYGDCFLEVGQQLSIIIMSNITVLATKFIYNGIYLRDKTKQFEGKVLEKYTMSGNLSNKMRYYTRSEFDSDDVSSLFLPIIFNFGYIVQFGVASPISFCFVLFLVLFMRITNSVSMFYLFYVKTFNESHGIGLLNTIQGMLSYIGIITNLCLIFYTNTNFIQLGNTVKLLYMLITENVILLLLKVFYFARMPKWFAYKGRIEVKYLKKHGIRPKLAKDKFKFNKK